MDVASAALSYAIPLVVISVLLGLALVLPGGQPLLSQTSAATTGNSDAPAGRDATVLVIVVVVVFVMLSSPFQVDYAYISYSPAAEVMHTIFQIHYGV